MVARMWSARAAPQNLERYRGHFAEHVLPELQTIAGFRGAQLFTRSADNSVEILVVTFWNSLAAIDAFASPDREAAVVAPEAAQLLTGYDRRVRHFEAALDTFAVPNS